MRSPAERAAPAGTLFVVSLVLLASVSPVAAGNCGVCQPGSHVACHTDSLFSICVDGYPTYDYIECPDGHVCSSEAAAICLPAESASPSCVADETRCGICNEARHYACLDEHTVALCLGTGQPSPVAISYCPAGSVCDLDNPKEMCSDQAVAKPSCVADLSDPHLLCSLLATANGAFLDNLSDVTCQTYVFCSLSNNVWTGAIGKCSTGNFFDSATGRCKAVVPLRCQNAQVLLAARLSP